LRSEVDRRDANELDDASFLIDYVLPNRPVLVRGLTSGWPACADWVRPDGAPDVAALAARYGASAAPVADCAAAEEAPRPETTLAEYARYWAAHAAGGDARTLYLKDWHLAAETPPGEFYTPPPLFRHDALNMYFDARRQRASASASCCADYRFVYVGPAGSATPLHCDVLHSASWSANIAGVKQWLLFPPAATPLLRSARGALPADAQVALDACDPAFPRLSEAAPLRVTQRAGETLFVPPGWHHQVLNATAAASINHNWVHPAAMHWVLAFVRSDAQAAAEAICDLRPPALPAHEFEALVQRNAAANGGMDYAMLAAMAWRGAQEPLAVLTSSSGGEGITREALAAALACQRCGRVLRALAAEPPRCFAHHAEDGDAAVQPAAWADAVAAALTAAGLPPC
jgi:uncharacterized RmlC-like cupin family protein